jgi:uncharacterized protein
MPLPPSRALCVTVSPIGFSTWPVVAELLNAIDEVDRIPVTLLVAPNYQEKGGIGHSTFEQALTERLLRGDELGLFGFSCVDPEPILTLRDQVARKWYAQGQAEFSALSTAEARQRLRAGCRWFHNNGWPIGGFVPPGGLLSEGSWNALKVSPFEYTATRNYLHDLRVGDQAFSPSIVYGRSGESTGRLETILNNIIANARDQPLVRLSLHPRVGLKRKSRLAWQRQLGKLLVSREAVTNRDWICARRQVSTTEQSRLGPNENTEFKTKSSRTPQLD